VFGRRGTRDKNGWRAFYHTYLTYLLSSVAIYPSSCPGAAGSRPLKPLEIRSPDDVIGFRLCVSPVATIYRDPFTGDEFICSESPTPSVGTRVILVSRTAQRVGFPATAEAGGYSYRRMSRSGNAKFDDPGTANQK
jgi:hypothetical protein